MNQTNPQEGKVGWALAWLLGVPLPHPLLNPLYTKLGSRARPLPKHAPARRERSGTVP
jgi:hypothetical protein